MCTSVGVLTQGLGTTRGTKFSTDAPVVVILGTECGVMGTRPAVKHSTITQHNLPASLPTGFRGTHMSTLYIVRWGLGRGPLGAGCKGSLHRNALTDGRAPALGSRLGISSGTVGTVRASLWGHKSHPRGWDIPSISGKISEQQILIPRYLLALPLHGNPPITTRTINQV